MENIKHECGIAMIRLRKPLEYYKEKYGTYFYGFNKLYLLMEKQHNRGQEGAGFCSLSLSAEPGKEYIHRERALGSGAIKEIFADAKKTITQAEENNIPESQLPHVAELYMGHLRYSTGGRKGVKYVHPFLRRSSWRSESFMLCGNFTMTNTDEIFQSLVEKGQHPRVDAETIMLLEQLSFALDKENKRCYDIYKAQCLNGIEIQQKIKENLVIKNIIKDAPKTWDGGYVVCGAVGNGDMFVLRDSNGIRPAFYYYDDEIVVVASERPVIQTVMNVSVNSVKELTPGSAIIVNAKGDVEIEDILGEKKNEKCSFERIYISRGNDKDIYNERKSLGRTLAPSILKSIDYDIEHTVFSFIPNTAEVAYFGMMEGMENYLTQLKFEEIQKLDKDDVEYADKLKTILSKRVRTEKIAIKDIKLRTFITEGQARNDLAAHVYDVTYGQVQNFVDNLVVIDDSIVRGTTLKESIIRILDRLHPKKIVIVSSCPQVRYPDYYGIDMSRMAEFAAFRAAVELLKERNMEYVLDDTYKKCKEQAGLPKEEIVNYVKDVYAPFTDDEISKKIAEMLTPEGINAEIELVYHTLEGMHQSIPDNHGDWYFSGNYPTPGGNKLVNKAFIDYYEGDTKAPI